LPGWIRLGTRKSRAPSGEEAVRIGVEYSPEAGFRHPVAHVGYDLAALDDVGVQRLAPQVDEAVFQPNVFGVVRLAEHRQRQFPGDREHLDFADEHLDLAGRQVGVDRILGALLDLPVDADHPLGAHLLHVGEGRRIRIDHALGQPIVVAQVDEQQPAMVAHAMHPAAEPHGITGICGGELGTGMRAVSVQCHLRSQSEKVRNLGAEKRTRAAACQGERTSRARLSLAQIGSGVHGPDLLGRFRTLQGLKAAWI
jgi:hypothetical protein